VDKHYFNPALCGLNPPWSQFHKDNYIFNMNTGGILIAGTTAESCYTTKISAIE